MMHTSLSAQGLLFPYSGKLLNLFLDGCALKQPLYEASKTSLPMSQKTLQRYFNGEFLKDQEENVAKILEQLAEMSWPKHLETHQTLDLHYIGTRALKVLMSQWDTLTRAANTEGFKLQKSRDQLLVMARFGTLELGLRLGALFALLGIPYSRVEQLCNTNALGQLIEEYRGDLSWEQFIEPRHKTLTLQSLNHWRTAKNFPQQDSLQDLVDCCVPNQPKDSSLRDATLLKLRLARLSDWVWSQLEKHLNQSFSDRIKETFLTTVRLIQRFLSEDCLMDGPSDVLYVALIIFGSSHPYGKRLCERVLMPPTEMFEEITLDLDSMIHETFEGRIQHWLRQIGSISLEVELAQKDDPAFKEQLLSALPTNNSEREKQILETILKSFAENPLDLMLLHYGSGDYSTSPVSKDHVVTYIRPPAAFRGYNEYTHLTTQGRELEAAQLMRDRLKEDPRAPNRDYTYFLLAAALGQVLGRLKLLPFELYIEAIAAINKAIELAPQKGVYHNEKAIILSNAQRRAEAEEAYILAEPLYGHQSTHWHGRGMNYILLGEYQKAQRAFERAMECSTGDHVSSMEWLAIVLMKNGEKLRAGKLGQALEKRGQRNPVPHWERILDEYSRQVQRR